MESSIMTNISSDFSPLTSLCSSVVSKPQFSQVVFNELKTVYDTASDIRCRCTFDSEVQPQPGDKIGLFRVGWSKTNEYICFEPVPLASANDREFTVVFQAHRLPKDGEIYQLCYITGGFLMGGTSAPFSFEPFEETELIGVEDPSDPDLLIISKADEEKETLLDKFTSLKNELKRTIQKNICLDTEKGELQLEIKRLNTKLIELKEEKKILEETLKDPIKENEIKSLKAVINTKEEEIVSLKHSIECLKQENNEKDSSLDKLSALENDLKLSKAELSSVNLEKNTIVNKVEELKIKVKELEEEKKVLEDIMNNRIKSLENDVGHFQTLCSKKDEEMNYLKECLNCCKKDQDHLFDNFQDALQKSKDNQLLLKQCKDLEEQLKKLALCQNITNGQKLNLERELVISKNENEGLVAELKFKEEELSESLVKILTLEDEIELLTAEPNNGASASLREESLINKRITNILVQKASIRAELVAERHKNQENVLALNEFREENAALRSRICVLEKELATCRSTQSINPFPELEVDSTVDSNNSLGLGPSVSHFYETSNSECTLSEVIRQQSNLEHLHQEARHLSELETTKAECNQLKKQLDEMTSLNTTTNLVSDLENRLAKVTKEKEALARELLDIKKEMIGKFSLAEAQELKYEITRLKKKLEEKDRVRDATKVEEKSN